VYWMFCSDPDYKRRVPDLRPLGLSEPASGTQQTAFPRLAGFPHRYPYNQNPTWGGGDVPTARAAAICLNARYCSSEVRHFYARARARLDRARLGVEVPERRQQCGARPAQAPIEHPHGPAILAAGEDAKSTRPGWSSTPRPMIRGLVM